MNKNQNITIINGSELLSKLEQPLDELRTGVRNLQAEVRRKTTVKYYTISEACDILHVSRSSINRVHQGWTSDSPQSREKGSNIGSEH